MESFFAVQEALPLRKGGGLGEGSPVDVYSDTMSFQTGPTKRRTVTIEKARWLRRKQTVTEMLLWRELRNRRLQNIKFRRQVPIGPFIVDFYCAEANLIIEIDGDAHDAASAKIRDIRRELYMRKNGYGIIRFTNDEVNRDIGKVLKKIVVSCERVQCS